MVKQNDRLLIKDHRDTYLKQVSAPLILPEEEWPRPLDIPLAVALDARLEDEGVSVEVVVRGDRAVLTAAACVLHHHRHWQGYTAEVLWRTQHAHTCNNLIHGFVASTDADQIKKQELFFPNKERKSFQEGEISKSADRLPFQRRHKEKSDYTPSSCLGRRALSDVSGSKLQLLYTLWNRAWKRFKHLERSHVVLCLFWVLGKGRVVRGR